MTYHEGGFQRKLHRSEDKAHYLLSKEDEIKGRDLKWSNNRIHPKGDLGRPT